MDGDRASIPVPGLLSRRRLLHSAGALAAAMVLWEACGSGTLSPRPVVSAGRLVTPLPATPPAPAPTTLATVSPTSAPTTEPLSAASDLSMSSVQFAVSSRRHGGRACVVRWRIPASV